MSFTHDNEKNFEHIFKISNGVWNYLSRNSLQGHCLSTINPSHQGRYDEDIGNVPTFQINPDPYHIPPADDKTISTEGCFSCKVRVHLFFILS